MGIRSSVRSEMASPLSTASAVIIALIFLALAVIVFLAMYLIWPIRDGSGVPEIRGKGPGNRECNPPESRQAIDARQRRLSDERALISRATSQNPLKKKKPKGVIGDETQASSDSRK